MTIKLNICNKGAYIFTNDLTEKELNTIKNIFTIRNKNIRGFWDIIKCYSYIKVYGEICILFPRFGAFELNKYINLKSASEIKKGKTTDFTLIAEFKGNQKLVFDEIINNYFRQKRIKQGLAGVIVNLEAGQGKTFLSLHIITYLKVKTFIIVHNELILQQWVKVISAFIPDAKIGLWYGKQKTITEDSNIIISIINSALLYENWDKIGLCIFDEVHLYCSKGRAEIFDKCQSTYMLGLSATPEDRKEKNDNTYKIIQWQIGPILVASELEGYTIEEIPFKCNVNMIKYYGHPDYIETHINEYLDMVSNTKMIKQLTDDPYRIKLIVKLTKDIIQEPKTNLFIFSCRRSYLENIYKELNDDNTFMLTNELEASVIMGQSAQEDVDNAEKNSRIILTTYQYFGTGKSIPRMNAMIIATPFKTGIQQFAGRIFRLGSDYTIVRKIIDIVDWETTLKSQWYSRAKYYKEKDFPITQQKIKWSD
jgi:superfamily II DNA or RNA helicase